MKKKRIILIIGLVIIMLANYVNVIGESMPEGGEVVYDSNKVEYIDIQRCTDSRYRQFYYYVNSSGEEADYNVTINQTEISFEIPDKHKNKYGDKFEGKKNGKKINFTKKGNKYVTKFDPSVDKRIEIGKNTIIIILLEDAWKLDLNRNVIENLTYELKDNDDIIATLQDGEYVRVLFQSPLDSSRIINVFLDNVLNNYTYIELYKKDSDVLLGKLYSDTSKPSIDFLLTSMNGTEIEFDLRIMNGSLDIDFITDPDCTGELVASCGTYLSEAGCITHYQTYPPESETFSQCVWGGFCSPLITLCSVPGEIGDPVTGCIYIDEDNTQYNLQVNITNSDTSVCVDINANNVTFNCYGRTVDGIDGSSSIGFRIRNNKANVTIDNCVINDWYYGIRADYTSSTKIKNNTITSNNYMPAYMRSSQDLRFYNNTVTDNRNYLYFLRSNNGIFKGNTVVAETYGMINYDNTDGSYRNNQIIGNTITALYPLYWANIFNNSYHENYLYSTSRTMYGSSTKNYNTSFYNNYVSCAGAYCMYLSESDNPAQRTVFNTTLTATTNIMGGSNIGGNYWTNPSKKGYSDKCADADKNGICDATYDIPNARTGVSYYDYLPISNVTIVLTQSFSTPLNDSTVGSYPNIIVNVRSNVGWDNSTLYFKNSTMNWTKITDCSNESINGNININYICVWNNTNLSSAGEGYDVKVISFDKSANNATSINHYYVDLTLPQTAFVEADFPEYPFSRFRPSIENSYVVLNRLINLNGSDNDIVGYYNFDTDTTLGEDKINDNNGTFVNGVGITPTATGKFGKALNLDGVDDYMDIGNSTDFDFTNKLTLSAYVKTVEEGYVIAKDPDAGYIYQPIVGTLKGSNINWNYMMGYEFTPTTTGATMTEICGYFSGTKTIKVQDSAYAVLLTDTLTSSNAWTCKSITPISLTKDETYHIGVALGGTGGSYDSFSSPRTNNGITIVRSIYQFGVSTFTSSHYGSTSYMYGKVDFKVSYGKGEDVPYSLSTHNGGKFEIQSSSVNYIITAPTGINASDGNWHLLTATYSDSNMSLYVDGLLVNSTSDYTGDVPENDLPVWIGRSYNPGETTGYFDGQIDDVMLLNRTLNPTEIANLNNSLYTRFLQTQNYTLKKNITNGIDIVKVQTFFNSYEGTGVNLILGYYNTTGWTYFNPVVLTSGIYQEYTVPITSTNISLNYTLNSSGFYTPEIYNNISITTASTSASRQTSIRNTQTVVLRVNASDTDTGIDNVTIDIIELNNTGNVTMSLQSGSLSAGEWGYFNLSVLNVNNTEGNIFPLVRAYDTVGNVRGSDTFSVFFDNTPTNISYITNLTGAGIILDTESEFGTSISISWSVLDSSPLAPNGYYILSNNITAIWNNDTQGYLNVDGNGEVEFAITEVGNFSYQLFTFDDAGNMQNSTIYTFGVGEGDSVEIIITYPNNNTNFTNRTHTILFSPLNINPDNCSLFNNNVLIETKNDTNVSHEEYNFTEATFEFGENILRVDCLKTGTTYSSKNILFTVAEPTLGLIMVTPLVNSTVTNKSSFNWDVNVTCTLSDCGILNVTLTYNSTHFNLNDTFNQSITLLINESQIVSWNVTANGSLGSYLFNTKVKRDDFIVGVYDYENKTDDLYVDIISIPPNFINISFINPTLSDGVTIDNTSFIVNISILNASNLEILRYSTNVTGTNTNYTMYNNSLILMMNFDNVSEIDDGGNKTVDVSIYGNNGTCMQTGYGINCSYVSGRYGKALDFNTTTYVNITGLSNLEVTQEMWVKNASDTSWFYIANVSGTQYVDGVVGNNREIPISNSTGNVLIGRNYNGSIDEVRIWNISLDKDTIYQHYVSNLNKYDTDKWLLYVNQSLNATDELPNGVYNYSGHAYNGSIWNSTEQRIVTISATASDTTTPTFNETYPNQTLEYFIDNLVIDLNATDSSGVDSWYTNDTTRFNISQNGNLINFTTITIGIYYVRVSVNDTLNNTASLILNVNVSDTIAPSFNETYPNQTLEFNVNSLLVDFNATDVSGVDSWYTNDTTLFNITQNGILKNKTLTSVGIYYINVSVNDTFNNINSTIMNINVTDTIAPTFDEYPNNVSLEYSVETLYIDVNATDETAIDTWFVNDTTRFNISQRGVLKNKTKTPVGTYFVNVSVNDTINNIASLILNINVTDTCAYTGGNLNINITCTYTDTTLNIDGNLTIFENGYVVLIDSFLNFNSTNQYIRYYEVTSDMDKIRFNGTSGIN